MWTKNCLPKVIHSLHILSTPDWGYKKGKYRCKIKVYSLYPHIPTPSSSNKVFIYKNMQTMLETQNCPHCGASMKSFIHTLTPGLVSILIKAIGYVRKHGKNEFHYRDLNLNYSEASNLQKLRLHALIAHADKDHIKSGKWLITTRGGQFLRGEINIPRKVKTFRNTVTGHSKEKIHINELKNKFPSFESEFAYEYKVPKDILKQQPLLV